MNPTMTKPHTHKCRNCGDTFVCDKAHYTVTLGGKRSGKLKPSTPPVEVASCAKPDCAFRGF